MAPPTILAHKASFLTAQTLRLSQPLAPSTTWASSSPSTSDAAPSLLPPRAVDDAVVRLNHALRRHARQAYAPQASRHVAEQIEQLFLEAGERAVARGARDGDEDEEDDDDEEDEEGEDNGDAARGEDGLRIGRGGRLRVGADFATDECIAALPASWTSRRPAEADAHPPEARRYADLAAQLAAQASSRRAVAARVDRLRRLRALLDPFFGGDHGDHDDGDGDGGDGDNNTAAGTNNNALGLGLGSHVQQNLVTRGGEVERELERMRVLLARVGGRVARLPPPPRTTQGGEDGDGDGDEDGDMPMVLDVDAAERDKVARLLDGF
ncbi:kinetochore complex Fta4 of Sim4 subunit, or CENP-50-domain-containing protein [Xylariaceae sp. FL0804]|nr:kinetochore complex Fta4 of Sim4 subunit, or CENP-50-domain-containing protein [Xylariaceae sp. FL0804]